MDGHDQVQQLYAASAARLVAQLYALSGDYGEAQDAVHEAFVRALARPGRLRQVDNPEAWLRTVALNVARSRYRRRMIFDRLVRSGRLAHPEHLMPGLSPDHVALVTALQQVPRALREAVVLHHLADLPVAEVARTLGCSVEAAKTRLVRGRRALAAQLTAPDVDPPEVGGGASRISGVARSGEASRTRGSGPAEGSGGSGTGRTGRSLPPRPDSAAGKVTSTTDRGTRHA